MKMLEAFRALIFGPVEEPKTFATATTPDDLIAERLAVLVTAHYDEWKVERAPDHDKHKLEAWKENIKQRWPSMKFAAVDTVLSRADIIIHFRDLSYSRGDGEGTQYFVNGVSIEDKAGNRVFEAFDKIRRMSRAQKMEQERIKREMELLEKKWDLAENVLGLERTALGALQPKGGYTQ